MNHIFSLNNCLYPQYDLHIESSNDVIAILYHIEIHLIKLLFGKYVIDFLDSPHYNEPWSKDAM